MVVLWNQGLRVGRERVSDSKWVSGNVLKNVLVRNKLSAISGQPSSGQVGVDSEAVLLTGVPVEHVSILLGR